MSKSILGIDVSKDTLDVALLHDEQLLHIQIENNDKGFKILSQWLHKHRVQTVHACMEATGTYFEAVAGYFYQSGQQVSVVNPRRIKAYGESLLTRNKTDKSDAQVIAAFCRAQDPALWSPPEPAVSSINIAMGPWIDAMGVLMSSP